MPDKNKSLPLTLESFPVVAALVMRRQELQQMIADDRWLPDDWARVIPDHLLARLKDGEADNALLQTARKVVAEIDRELVRYGFSGLPA